MQNGSWVTSMVPNKRVSVLLLLRELARKCGHSDPHSSCNGAMCGMGSPKHFSGIQ